MLGRRERTEVESADLRLNSVFPASMLGKFLVGSFSQTVLKLIFWRLTQSL